MSLKNSLYVCPEVRDVSFEQVFVPLRLVDDYGPFENGDEVFPDTPRIDLSRDPISFRRGVEKRGEPSDPTVEVT